MPRKSAAALEVMSFLNGEEDDEPVFRRVHVPEPPGHLSLEMKAWWREVASTYKFEDHHYKLLEACCSAWDRMASARKEIGANGLTYVDSKCHVRPHPAVAIERDARIGFARLIRELGLAAPSGK
jgi:P27 family predicted phage terminase small subunit